MIYCSFRLDKYNIIASNSTSSRFDEPCSSLTGSFFIQISSQTYLKTINERHAKTSSILDCSHISHDLCRLPSVAGNACNNDIFHKNKNYDRQANFWYSEIKRIIRLISKYRKLYKSFIKHAISVQIKVFNHFISVWWRTYCFNRIMANHQKEIINTHRAVAKFALDCGTTVPCMHMPSLLGNGTLNHIPVPKYHNFSDKTSI